MAYLICAVLYQKQRRQHSRRNPANSNMHTKISPHDPSWNTRVYFYLGKLHLETLHLPHFSLCCFSLPMYNVNVYLLYMYNVYSHTQAYLTSWVWRPFNYREHTHKQIKKKLLRNLWFSLLYFCHWTQPHVLFMTSHPPFVFLSVFFLPQPFPSVL